MTEELGEERWESFKTSMNGRGSRRSAGIRAKQRKGWHREEEDEVRQRSLELRLPADFLCKIGYCSGDIV